MSAPSTATSRAGRKSPWSPAVSRVRARPCREASSETEARNSADTASSNAWLRLPLSSRPIDPVRPRASARAAGSGPTYPSSSAAARIRSRSSAESWSGRENAFDTVIRLTPTRSAIDWRVTLAMGDPVSRVPPRSTRSAGLAAAAWRRLHPAGGGAQVARGPQAQVGDGGTASALGHGRCVGVDAGELVFGQAYGQTGEHRVRHGFLLES